MLIVCQCRDMQWAVATKQKMEMPISRSGSAGGIRSSSIEQRRDGVIRAQRLPVAQIDLCHCTSRSCRICIRINLHAPCEAAHISKDIRSTRC